MNQIKQNSLPRQDAKLERHKVMHTKPDTNTERPQTIGGI